MLCGVAQAWMRCGKVTGGTFVQGFILKISKGCAAGFMKMEAFGPFRYSSVEHLEPKEQTQAESHVLPYQRFAKNGRGELE